MIKNLETECHITVSGMKSCRLRAISYQGTSKLKRAAALEFTYITPILFINCCVLPFFDFKIN
jgi:hypothetical protein